MNLSQDTLRQLLDYDPITGTLVWKHRANHWFSSDRIAKSWNTRYAGKEAFTAINSDGYKTGSILGKPDKAHRVIHVLVTGIIPDEIDHQNGKTTDNSWDNICDVSHEQNGRNLKRRRDNTSGYTGVYPYGSTGKFKASIRYMGNMKHLGVFDTLIQASKAYEDAKHSLGFSSRHGTNSS